MILHTVAVLVDAVLFLLAYLILGATGVHGDVQLGLALITAIGGFPWGHNPIGAW